MGSFSDLQFGSRVVASSKNSIFGNLLSLIFCQDDLCVYDIDTEEICNDQEKAFENIDSYEWSYEVDAKIAAKRLDIQGFTYEKSLDIVIDGFVNSHVAQIEDLNFDDYNFTSERKKKFEDIESLIRSAKRKINKFNFIDAIREINDKGIYSIYNNLDDKSILSAVDNELIFLFQNAGTINQLLLSLYFEDEIIYVHYARVLIEVLCEEDDEIIYDVGGVYRGGWVDIRDINWEERDTIVIITEGKSDMKFIKTAMEVISKDYIHLFSFLDFHTSNSQGGADYLVNFAKSIIGCRLKSKFLVIFDNDSAGNYSYNRLLKENPPDNIRILKYPYLDEYEEYPFLIDGVKEIKNVNSKAGSIEFYFGREVLLIDEELTRVNRTGYMKKINGYQYSIDQKSKVQKLIKIKLSKLNTSFSKEEWRDTIKLISSIEFSFSHE